MDSTLNAPVPIIGQEERPSTIHLIDLENHVFSPDRKTTLDDVAKWWMLYWVIGHAGPNGAEQAILAAVYPPHAALKYRRAVVASGDGAFINFVYGARDAGMLVQVVSAENSLHPNLANAASVRTIVRRTSRNQMQLNLARVNAVHAATLAA